MFKRAFLEGFKNVIRSFWLSFTAISVLTFSLASVILVGSLSTIVGFSVRNLDNLISIPVFVKESYAEDKIPDLNSKIQSLPNVKKVEYYDKEKANQALKEGNIAVNLDFIKNQAQDDTNLVWRFFLVTPTSSENYGRVIESLKNGDLGENWKQVVGDENFVNNLISFNSWIRIIGIILILVFALFSISVMINIIRITIYNHKDEIEIMRLVGATNSYIRAPFIAEGVFFNLIAAIVVSIFFIPSFNIFLPSIASWIGSNSLSVSASTSQLMVQIYTFFGITLLAGIIVGGVTSFMATQRYLKL